MTGNIAKGTKVRLTTSNGGDTIVRLASMYSPTYGCWFTGFRLDNTPMPKSFYRNADDIVSVEPFVCRHHADDSDCDWCTDNPNRHYIQEPA